MPWLFSRLSVPRTWKPRHTLSTNMFTSPRWLLTETRHECASICDQESCMMPRLHDSIGGAGIPPTPLMIPHRLALGLLASGTLALAQSCQNYGILQGSTCLCPSGFGGSDCSSPACGGTIFQGSSRKTVPAPGNLTSAGCACQDGWSGVGCNVCTSSNACQSGYTSQNPTNGNGVTGSNVGRNDTLVCNSAFRVWAAGQMSCSVIVEFIHVCLNPRKN